VDAAELLAKAQMERVHLAKLELKATQERLELQEHEANMKLFGFTAGVKPEEMPASARQYFEMRAQIALNKTAALLKQRATNDLRSKSPALATPDAASPDSMDEVA